jgi:hypothetical protein
MDFASVGKEVAKSKLVDKVAGDKGEAVKDLLEGNVNPDNLKGLLGTKKSKSEDASANSQTDSSTEEKPKAESQIDTVVKNEIKRLSDEIADWKGREYKGNKKIVNVENISKIPKFLFLVDTFFVRPNTIYPYQNPLTMKMNDEVTICIRYLLITLATLITQGHQHDRANLLRVDCLRSGRRSLVPPPVAASLAGQLKTWTQSRRLPHIVCIHPRRMSNWTSSRKNNAEEIWATYSQLKALRVPQVYCSGNFQAQDSACEYAHKSVMYM